MIRIVAVMKMFPTVCSPHTYGVSHLVLTAAFCLVAQFANGSIIPIASTAATDNQATINSTSGSISDSQIHDDSQTTTLNPLSTSSTVNIFLASTSISMFGSANANWINASSGVVSFDQSWTVDRTPDPEFMSGQLSAADFWEYDFHSDQAATITFDWTAMAFGSVSVPTFNIQIIEIIGLARYSIDGAYNITNDGAFFASIPGNTDPDHNFALRINAGGGNGGAFDSPDDAFLTGDFTWSMTTVPEPRTAVLAIVGLAAVLLFRARRRGRATSVVATTMLGLCLGFSNSAQAVTISTVPVGNLGNATDPLIGNLYGSVSYDYRIGTTEVTVGP